MLKLKKELEAAYVSNQAKGIKDTESALQDVIENNYEGKLWWQTCNLKIFNELAAGTDPLLLISKIVGKCRENNTSKEKLPEYCYQSIKPAIELFEIRRGESGYYPIKEGYTKATAEELNEALGVNEAQAEAMLAGSMFGWDAPGADPDMYVEEMELPKNLREEVQ